ncbi:MAG: hypothetical protein MUP71_11880 [Candidatus Aminicenantes bacterium]|nr:hypothetical protein [Candidatus Aminicenantes bacterium]
MKKRFAFFTVVVFAFSLIAQAGVFEEGLKYLKLSRKAKLNENIKEETDFFQKAFKEFKRDAGGESLLLLLYTGLRLDRKSEIDRTAAEFIKKDRTGFLQSVFQYTFLNLDEKQRLSDYLNSVSEKIPFISNFAITGNGFHPFQKESPAVQFTLQADAACSFTLEGNMIRETQYKKGDILFPFAWQENFFGKSWLEAGFNSENALTSYAVNKKLKLFMDMPTGLHYKDGSFGINGKEFKIETKTVRKRNALYLLGTLIFASGAIAKKSPDATTTGVTIKSSTYIIISAICAGAYLFDAKKMSAPDKKNIKFNRELAEEIEKIKSDVKVNIEIEEED